MQVMLESTDKFVTVDGQRTRVWQGHSAAGVPLIAFVVRVMVDRQEDAAEFERELIETAPLRLDVSRIPSALASDPAAL